MTRVGVVGVGSMGQNHARLYSEMDCDLVGIADANQEQGREISEKFNTKYFHDYHDLLDKLDAVSIAVPTTLHHRVAIDFLSNGVHCLVEKPIAGKLDHAQEMIDTAKKNDVNLAIGHIEHFNPAVGRLKQIIDSGRLGQILMISTRRVGPQAQRIRDVGVVIDSATHDIGVSNYLLGKIPLHVFSKVGNIHHPINDHGIIVLDYQDTFASIEVNWFTPHKVRTLVATGSKGIAYLDYIKQSLTVHNGELVNNMEIKTEEPLKLELKDFLRGIRDRTGPLVSGEEGKAILEIALQANNGKG